MIADIRSRIDSHSKSKKLRKGSLADAFEKAKGAVKAVFEKERWGTRQSGERGFRSDGL